MPADKDAAKRRRQARNRQERAKRQTRVEGARRSEASRPARTREAVASTTRSSPTAKRAANRAARTPSEPAARPAGAAASGGLLGKLFPPRPAADAGDGDGDGPRPRPARAQPSQSVVYDVEDPGGARGWMLVRMAQPGGRPAMLALFVSIVSAVTLIAIPVLPRVAFEYYGAEVVTASAEHAGDSGAETAALVEQFEEGDTISAGTARLSDVVPITYTLVFSIIPIAICALAVLSLTKPTRSRTLLISALAAAMYVFFSQGIGTFFVLGVAALGWGAYKSRKADALAAAEDAEAAAD